MYAIEIRCVADDDGDGDCCDDGGVLNHYFAFSLTDYCYFCY